MQKLIVAIFALALAAVSVAGQSPTLRIVTEDPNLPSELFYGNVKVKPLRLRPGTNVPITIDDTDFFVYQHYVDFLNRFPEQGGLDYWVSTFSNCGTNKACLDDRRIGVSAAFFIEQEFQLTGSYVYRLYQGSLGRHPSYAEFMPDRRLINANASFIEASKAAFANTFVQRPEFLAKYPTSLTNDQFVNAVLATMKAGNSADGVDGVDLSSQSGTYISQLNGGATRGQVTRQIIDNSTFINTVYNPSFVLMQYFGYLRRDPEQGGYLFWLDVLNNHEQNNFRGMVCSFITSAEYQLRFGSAITHTNQDCANVH